MRRDHDRDYQLRKEEENDMSDRANMHEPYHELGPEKKGGVDYILQGAIIYNWSESNLGYERAWWLTPNGDPISDSEHVRNLLRDRPFDKQWLTDPNMQRLKHVPR